MQWLGDPGQKDEDNLRNVRREASRHIKNKKREYLKDKINMLATNRKNKNIRDLYRRINEFKTVYRPRNNLRKDEIGGLLVEPHSILNRWRKYFLSY
jgi:protein tyrosine/serine phosphatase